MQMETSHMTCSAVRSTSPPHLACPPVTVTWNTVHKATEMGFNRFRHSHANVFSKWGGVPPGGVLPVSGVKNIIVINKW